MSENLQEIDRLNADIAMLAYRVGHLGRAIELTAEQGFSRNKEEALGRIDSLSQIFSDIGDQIVNLTDKIEGLVVSLRSRDRED